MTYDRRARILPTIPLAIRFWPRVQKGDGCWEWQGYRNEDGYGTVGMPKRQTIKAHRAAWELTNGPIPEGMHVLHRCDNPPCCNPDHLYLGTNRDNIADRDRKRRQAHVRGSLQGQARLTEELVRYLHRAAIAGRSQASLARELGVSVSTVNLAIQGKTWAHVFEVQADQPSGEEPNRMNKEIDMDQKPEPQTREEQLLDALIWTTGASDFQPGGKARDGFEKIVLPLLRPRETPSAERSPKMGERTVPMPRGAKCARCMHPSKAHSVGVCLRKVGRNTKDHWGATVIHLCGCGVWQGPRPWLMEGPAWAR